MNESAEGVHLYMCVQRYSLKYAVLCSHTSKAIHTETISYSLLQSPSQTQGALQLQSITHQDP